MLPGFRGDQRELCLDRGRHGEGDGVHVREQRLEVVVRRDAQLRRQNAGLLRAKTPDTDQLDTLGCDQPRAVRQARPGPRSNQTESHPGTLPRAEPRNRNSLGRDVARGR